MNLQGDPRDVALRSAIPAIDRRSAADGQRYSNVT